MFKQLIEAICFRLINGPLGAPSLDFRISRLDIKSGDMLVLRFKRNLSFEQVECVRKTLKPQLPGDVRVLVFEGDVDISVMSPQPKSESAVVVA